MGTERDDEERTMSEIIPWLPSGTNYQPSTRAVRDCSRLLSFEFFYPFFPSPNRFTIIKIIAKKFETILGILERIFIYFILWCVVQLREERFFFCKKWLHYDFIVIAIGSHGRAINEPFDVADCNYAVN